MSSNFSFFALAFRMKYITRWGLMKNTRSESLTEHCTETAMIAHCLALVGNKFYGKNYNTDKIAAVALYHDLTEVITGDLPTPIKYYNKEILENYKKIEKNAAEKFLSKLPEELYSSYKDILDGENDADIKIIVKSADKLAALIKCIEEVKNGNSEFSEALKSTRAAIDKIELPEVKYFIENLLPPFYLTLDEL